MREPALAEIGRPLSETGHDLKPGIREWPRHERGRQLRRPLRLSFFEPYDVVAGAPHHDHDRNKGQGRPYIHGTLPRVRDCLAAATTASYD
jgi:hypothetical protein